MLAPIAAVTESELPGVVGRLKERLGKPRYRKMAGQLWTAIDVLMGLRYERPLVEQLLQGVRGMKESVTYQAIVEEGVVKGRLEEARKILLRVGEQLFGEQPTLSDRHRVESINNLEALERLTDQALRLQSWSELLADVPVPEPRRVRKKKS